MIMTSKTPNICLYENYVIEIIFYTRVYCNFNMVNVVYVDKVFLYNNIGETIEMDY